MSRRPTININTRRENQPMKVVHIKTQYVETDATSFKSVVQNLTGKDSTIPESPKRNYSSSSLAIKVKKRDRSQRVSDGGIGGGVGSGGGGSLKFLSRDLSFDRLFKELPTVDELHKLFNL
ncbi:VQ motif-containing protein 10-like [Silene latifolia]|uniref:VQ motif-containing protein 10-like n=1 Tax=Silene latifolia TaxID=37657 RepID=UPI003D76FFE4